MSIRNQFASLPPQGLQHLRLSALELERKGPLLHAELHMPAPLVAATQKPAPPPETGMMLIDTGASKTTVCEIAIQKLGVSAVGVTQVHTPSGVAQQLLYPAEILFVGFMPKVGFATVIGSPYMQAQNILGLVGRDLLKLMQLVYNGPMGCFTLSI